MSAALSPDSQAIALVCSSLGGSSEPGAKPLTPSQWRDLSAALHGADLRPRDLLALPPAEIAAQTGASTEMAERLADLLSRGGQLALELERLASLGIWILTRADDGYPQALKERLGRQAPPLLYGAGPQGNLGLPGIAIVGSREVDEGGTAFASALAERCAEQGFAVVSGGARGVDLTAMSAAVRRGGAAVGITVDPLERLVRRRELRQAIAEELLTLTTPFHPTARWHAGNAMSRNRLVYAMSRAAVVVASSAEKGGTRAGALENLKAGWVPLFVRDDGSPGNSLLLAEGAHPLSRRQPIELDLQSLVEAATEPAPAAGGESPGPSTTPQTDAYTTVWPLLESVLREPQSEQDVAEKLDLQPTQARTWLKRALAENKVEATKRPKRYVVPGRSADQLRLDGA